MRSGRNWSRHECDDSDRPCAPRLVFVVSSKHTRMLAANSEDPDRAAGADAFKVPQLDKFPRSG
ncbi:hypothetical protein ACVWZZ_007591 [Bradyrhizobium sp. LM6.10]|jgi:hypothetical protein